MTHIDAKHRRESGRIRSSRSLRSSYPTAAKSAVNDINKVIAKNIEKASKDAIAATVANLKVSIAT